VRLGPARAVTRFASRVAACNLQVAGSSPGAAL
jgi:hypothetical protein